VARDVSERQAAEARARREAELFEAVVENVPVVAFRLDADGEFRRWAGAGLDRIPERFELAGLTLSELESVAPELATNCRRALDGEALRRTVSFLGREWRSWYQPVERGGQLQGAVGFALDVTDRHRREEMIEVLDRVLRHNLRNDMNIVLAAAQRIAEGEGDPERAAERVRETTHDLLELADTARDIRGVVDPERDRDYGAVDPAPVVATACDRVGAGSATVRAAVEDDLPAVPDPGLELAIRELVDNAVEHGGAAPTVDVSVGLDADSAEERVRIRVADDGPGLPEMERRVLTGSRETPLKHGQGLGLWLVYWVVREAGGDLSVAVEDGTAVELRLPVAD
jgi:signal transduction histidine kinase